MARVRTRRRNRDGFLRDRIHKALVGQGIDLSLTTAQAALDAIPDGWGKVGSKWSELEHVGWQTAHHDQAASHPFVHKHYFDTWDDAIVAIHMACEPVFVRKG